MKRFVVRNKAAGETPLQTLEQYRAQNVELTTTSLAYAGRLDPMASGKLLILIGEECKRQKHYHALDKEYYFQILFGVRSDTGDILGRLEYTNPPHITKAALRSQLKTLPHTISLPYPHFSAKTVYGKPLHVWTLERRLDEITIPTQTSHLYRCSLDSLTHYSGQELYDNAKERIDRLPTVTEASKALGGDFRRPAVRRDWEQFRASHHDNLFPVATIRCIASSGTYMRSLAEYIAQNHQTHGLAFTIHRSKIGHYRPFTQQLGWWTTQYR